MKLLSKSPHEVVVGYTDSRVLVTAVVLALATSYAALRDQKHPTATLTCARHAWRGGGGGGALEPAPAPREDNDCELLVTRRGRTRRRASFEARRACARRRLSLSSRAARALTRAW